MEGVRNLSQQWAAKLRRYHKLRQERKLPRDNLRQPAIEVDDPQEKATTSSTLGVSNNTPCSLQILAGIQTATDLCKRCSSLNIPELYGRKLSHWSGVSVNLGLTPSALRASECPMCRFFGTVASSFDHPHKGWLHTVPVEYACMGLETGPRFIDKNVLFVNSSRYERPTRNYLWLIALDDNIPRKESPWGARLLDPESFDVKAASHWISYCRSNHTTSCRLASLPLISSFQVIDCETETVIKAPPHCQYIALSYVWGEGSVTNSSLSSLRIAPKVILDSIEVTKKLSFRYLWIDRYCIDQSDLAGKHEQICQMDLIYASAQVTIIAADSDDPSRGLPGVRGTLRTPQPIFRGSNYQIVSSLQDSPSVISQSKWATRGWTYQEGLLSKRRLIFSADQMRFECNGMHCCEAVHLPLDEMHDKTTGKFLSSEFSTGFRLKNIGENPWEFMDHVDEFSSRNLSFPTDVLNAMRGIFHFFEKGQYPMFQLMGVPIMPPYSNQYVSSVGTRKQLTLIQQSPETGFIIGLLWMPMQPISAAPNLSSRRRLFPSWSWSSCNLRIWPSDHPRSRLCKFHAQISVELFDGSILPFPQEHSLVPEFALLARDSKFIHIAAKTSSCYIVARNGNIEFPSPSLWIEYTAFLTGDDKLTICLDFHADIRMENGKTFEMEPSLVGKPLTAIIFAPDTSTAHEYPQASVVIDEYNNKSFAERVGICLGTCNRMELTASCKWGAGPFLNLEGSDCVFDNDLSPTNKAFMEWVDRRPTRTIRLG